MTPVCENCEGRTLVCENHRDKSWPEGCDCGPGMPCPVCRPAGGPPTDDDEVSE